MAEEQFKGKQKGVRNVVCAFAYRQYLDIRSYRLRSFIRRDYRMALAAQVAYLLVESYNIADFNPRDESLRQSGCRIQRA